MNGIVPAPAAGRPAVRHPEGGGEASGGSLGGYLLALPFYVALRLAYFCSGPVQRASDTVTYETVDFLARGSTRLFTVPLLYHLIPSDGRRAAAQLALSIVSWVVLAAVVARAVREPRLRLVTFGAVLLFSASTMIVTWDRFLIAESASFSLLALLVAAWMAFLRRPGGPTLAAASLVTVLFAFIRETHAALVAGVAAALLLWLFRSGERRAKAWAAALVSGIAAWSLTIVMQPHERTRFNMDNVIAQRVLTDPQRLAYFEKAGMPVTPKLLSLTGKWASSDGYAFFNAPELEGFRGWLEREFVTTYVRYLVSHPGWTLVQPLTDAQLFFPDPRQGTLPFYFEKQAVSFPLSGARPPGSKASLTVLLIVALVLAVWSGARGALVREAAVPIALVLSVVPHALLVWHGDAMEVARHGLPVAIGLRLGLMLLLLLSLDAVFATVPASRSAKAGRQFA